MVMPIKSCCNNGGVKAPTINFGAKPVEKPTELPKVVDLPKVVETPKEIKVVIEGRKSVESLHEVVSTIKSLHTSRHASHNNPNKHLIAAQRRINHHHKSHDSKNTLPSQKIISTTYHKKRTDSERRPRSLPKSKKNCQNYYVPPVNDYANCQLNYFVFAT